MRIRDPGWEKFGFRDEKNSVPGSAISIPDPQRCKKERIPCLKSCLGGRRHLLEPAGAFLVFKKRSNTRPIFLLILCRYNFCHKTLSPDPDVWILIQQCLYSDPVSAICLAGSRSGGFSESGSKTLNQVKKTHFHVCGKFA
jgi:hypothetical protein